MLLSTTTPVRKAPASRSKTSSSLRLEKAERLRLGVRRYKTAESPHLKSSRAGDVVNSNGTYICR